MFQRIIFLILLYGINQVNGQEVLNHKNESLLLDPSIRYGELSNGLKYYIKPISNEHAEVKMRFFIKVGSNNQNPHELDFAHHLEHLAFRETQSFPESLWSNSELLTGFGMSKANFNGYAGDASSGFVFDIPTGNPAAIKTGLAWYKDIANGLIITEETVNRERGVLLQEFRKNEANREGFYATNKLISGLFPCVPEYISFTEHNKTFSYVDLQEFYKKWYNPKFMAVVVVGNIKDIDELESKIIKDFSKLKNFDGNYDIKECFNSDFKDLFQFELVKRKSAGGDFLGYPVEVNLFFRGTLDSKFPINENVLESKIFNTLIESILRLRLEENTQGFNKLYSLGAIYIEDFKSFKVEIKSERGEEDKALKESFLVLNQLKSFGVTPKEFDFVKNDFLKGIENLNQENISYWLKQIEENFIRGEELPADKIHWIKKAINEQTLVEFNSRIHEIFSVMPAEIGIIIPEDYQSSLMTAKKVNKSIRKASETPLGAYTFSDVPLSLMSNEQINLLKVRESKELNSNGKEKREFILGNGLKIVLKPTESPFKTKKIVLHGFSPHGANCFTEKDYVSAINAPGIISNSGIGDIDRFQLERFLKNSVSLQMGVTPYISHDEAGIKGEANGEEIEDLLQLVYLFFTKPHKNRAAFEDWKTHRLHHVHRMADPQNDLYDIINEITMDHSSPPLVTKSISQIMNTDFERAYETYQNLIGNAKDFTFIFTGDFEVESLLPLAQKYLGNLPNLKTASSCVKKGPSDPNLPTSPYSIEVKPPGVYTVENSYYSLSFIRPQTSDFSWQEEIKVQALGAVTNRLIQKLRTDEGFSLYFFGVAGTYNRVMKRYEVGFNFSCIPQELPLIKKRTQQIISQVQQGYISREDFEDGMANMYRRYSSYNLSQAEKVNENLYNFYRYGKPVPSPLEMETFVKALNIEEIAKTAKKLYDDKYLFEVLMQ